MGSNKKSIWSVIILIASIISLVLFVSALVILIVGVPATRNIAYQAAIDAGETEDVANVIAITAMVTVIVVFAISSVFDVLKIIGGFLFSLKGKWGIFCIVVSIIGAVGSVVGLVNAIRNHSGAGTIVIDSLTLAVDALLVVACFKHRAELK